ncbi:MULTISPECIES: hypothetical protein [Mesorhizobium]|uniref:Uncharacterized protein n=1 Tax=Mesorhizobium muleiense TaxID=1004279 RepID=A0A1G9DNF7_9HYPH|nr:MULTISPECIES: hypothetical protein [Mesorhizobium]MCF6101867.1 hypothetical protein [Mesorhizobium muleiense]SDK65403.1 hypothetical protein SAMN05428953_11874 [Mesorhizobium muleiense]
MRGERADGRIIHLVVAPGHVITAPAWMIDPVACAAMDLGPPRVSLAALLELNKLLIERRFRRGSPDGFTIAEAQHENPAIPRHDLSWSFANSACRSTRRS